MNCEWFKKEALLALQLGLLRSPLPRVLRSYLLTIASKIDAIDWAPELRVLVHGYRSLQVCPPLNWDWPEAYISKAIWYLSPSDVYWARKQLVRIK
jgi:hypothetical protein